MDPPERNRNSRLALETGELVRAKHGDAAMARFHHAVSHAFFADRADIADIGVVSALAQRESVAPAEVARAWADRTYRRAVDDSSSQAIAADVTGVPAFAWETGAAVMGMREPDDLVSMLEQTAV